MLTRLAARLPATLELALALILALALAQPAATQQENDEDPADAEEAGRGFFQAGYMALDLSALNSSLVAAGLPALDEEVITLGGAGYGLRGRVLIGGEGHALLGSDETTTDGALDVSLGGGYGLFRLGYLLMEHDRLDVYPTVGIGGGSMSIRIRERSAPIFDDVLADPLRGATLSTGMFLLDLGFGVNYRFLVEESDDDGGVGGLLLGVQAGYTFAPGDTSWNLDDLNSVAGGPEAHIEGFYLRVSIGGWGHSGPDEG